MSRQRKRMGAVWVAMLAIALTAFGFVGSASAKLTGEFARFENCPRKTPGVDRCIYSVTTGGEVTLGSKTVPIVNPVVLQGGYNEVFGEGQFSNLVAATNGVTLSKSPQPVPGGLLGLVPPEGAPLVVKLLVELAAENGLTGVNSTVELARPVNEVELSELNLALAEGVALKMPVKVRLENPVLGNECYVGSSTNPLIWELRADTTNPPPPNEPITGNGGFPEFLEEGQIIELQDVVLVDNAWSAPAASGCGGPLLAPLIDPIVNTSAGLPAKAGVNTTILENTIWETRAFAVNLNDEENP